MSVASKTVIAMAWFIVLTDGGHITSQTCGTCSAHYSSLHHCRFDPQKRRGQECATQSIVLSLVTEQGD